MKNTAWAALLRRGAAAAVAAVLLAAALCGCAAKPGNQSGGQALAPPVAMADSGAGRGDSLKAVEAEMTASLVLWEDFNAFVAETNDAHHDAQRTGAPDAETHTAPYGDALDAFTAAEISRLVARPGAVALTLAPQQAAEDIETAFAMLRDHYGPYLYFGGDAAFDKAKEAALDAVSGLPQLSGAALADTLIEALAFVRDGHFQIGEENVTPRKEMYYVPGLYLEKGAAGWCLKTAGRTWLLEGLAGGLPQDYVKPTIGPAGRIVYGLFALAEEDEAHTLPGQATLSAGGRQRSLALSWRRTQSEFATGAAYQRGALDDIPLHTVRTMMDTGGASAALLEEFAASGEASRDEAVFIIDLRGNGGGNDRYPQRWYAGFTGQEPSISRAWAEKLTPLGVAAFQKQYPGTSVGGWRLPPTGEWNTYTTGGTWLDNDSLILVLVDGSVASAGESMMLYLRTLPNVVFVGTNTYGCALVPNNSTKYLPQSGVPMYFGQGLILYGGMDNFDGTGLAPDIWIDTTDAEVQLKRLCEYYGLGPVVLGSPLKNAA